MEPPPNRHPIESLLDETMRGLVLYARNWNATDAEDIVQEAFLRLTAESPFPESPKAWLYRVVRNLAIDQLRRERREKSLGDWFEPSQNGEPFDTEEVTTALEKLPSDIREIVISKIWGNLTFREIAELTGKPISTVHASYHDGIARLREILQ